MGIGLKRRWRTRRARWWAAGAVGVLLLGVAGVRVWSADAGDAPARPLSVAVDRGPVAVEVATSGTVQPATTRSLGFTVAGTVQTVDVRPGSVVTVGQRLAAVADADAAEAADAVQDAEDNLAEARTALTKARESVDDPVPSCPAGTDSRVRPVAWRSPQPSGTPTATPTTGTPTASASPTPRPTASSATPTRTPGRPTSTVTGAPSAPRPPVAPGQSGGPGCGADAGTATGGTDQILTAQRRVNQAEATLSEAREAVAGATITAPMAGTVLSVAGPVGSPVTRGAAFITLADTYAMQVSARFPEADAGALAVGQSATLSLANRPEQTFPATVVQVDPVGAVDGTMVRYGVVLSFTAAPENLLVGQSAAVTVRTGAVPDVLRVPSTAVHEGPDRTGTVLPADGGPARTVTLGLRGNQYAEITSGLAAGELVLRSW
ncbi:efflux RND transporter periplasmic adaptor subunit [Micromonospora sp. LH3U1]|uniref:efflux RND transporter periplasmic adaptor subunit n=1 Tax=Micromonospora sp. LH3U1 TaxID=3018339 RepID=UPI00234B8C2E|nr:efflux RND transporter periplasmic adaptor subunit [Micromonospora sp. LH3U1]WCN79005.1 efflux RND transporter periplasmic adaptor subunit [Micromonospora sp. LH3U1]